MIDTESHKIEIKNILSLLGMIAVFTSIVGIGILSNNSNADLRSRAAEHAVNWSSNSSLRSLPSSFNPISPTGPQLPPATNTVKQTDSNGGQAANVAITQYTNPSLSFHLNIVRISYRYAASVSTWNTLFTGNLLVQGGHAVTYPVPCTPGETVQISLAYFWGDTNREGSTEQDGISCGSNTIISLSDNMPPSLNLKPDHGPGSNY